MGPLVLIGNSALFWGEKTFKNRGHLGSRYFILYICLYCSRCIRSILSSCWFQSIYNWKISNSHTHWIISPIFAAKKYRHPSPIVIYIYIYMYLLFIWSRGDPAGLQDETPPWGVPGLFWQNGVILQGLPWILWAFIQGSKYIKHLPVETSSSFFWAPWNLQKKHQSSPDWVQWSWNLFGASSLKSNK